MRLFWTVLLLLAAPLWADPPPGVLVVTAPGLAEAWQPFADWKTGLGKPTRVVTTAEIAKTYPGRDLAEKIRACVLEHVTTRGAKWIVLGGDSRPGAQGLVPDRDTVHDVAMFGMRHADIPTDCYYVSATSWDHDGDGTFGAWPADMEAVDYGVACVGRVPVRTAADVAAYTRKVVAYESRYPSDGFGGRMVYTCPEPVAFAKLKRSWDDHVGKAWKGEVARFYSTGTPWDREGPGDHDLSPGNFVRMINDGFAGKMHIHGHGFLPVWVLEKEQTVGAEHVARMRNENAYPVITTVSCFTGQYDADEDPCITESMLRQPDGGAVAIVAPARAGFPAFHDRRDFQLMVRDGKLDGTTRTLTRFWELGLKDDLTAGEAFLLAKRELLEDARRSAAYHLCACELNLLGDPTLPLRAGPVATPPLKAPAKTAIGPATLAVVTAPGATVCAWKGDEVYVVARADARGRADLRVAPKTAGALVVTASGPSLNTKSRTVAVE